MVPDRCTHAHNLGRDDAARTEWLMTTIMRSKMWWEKTWWTTNKPAQATRRVNDNNYNEIWFYDAMAVWLVVDTGWLYYRDRNWN